MTTVNSYTGKLEENKHGETLRPLCSLHVQSCRDKQTLSVPPPASACSACFDSIPCFICPLAVGTLKEGDESESIRNDVDQDVFLMFTVVNENLSWYLDDNIQTCSDSASIAKDDSVFEESNLMHGKNQKKFHKHFNERDL